MNMNMKNYIHDGEGKSFSSLEEFFFRIFFVGKGILKKIVINRYYCIDEIGSFGF